MNKKGKIISIIAIALGTIILCCGIIICINAKNDSSKTAPTETFTETPTEEPTQVPTEEPTEEPTEAPTEVPTPEPTEVPADDVQFAIPADSKTFDINFAQTLFALNKAFADGPIAEKMAEYGIVFTGEGNNGPKPGDHTSFYATGSKTGYYGGKSAEVVCIVIHGTLTNEWMSNIDVAPSRDYNTQYAENFLAAADDIYSKVKNNLSEDKIIVVTGYSRGAAVANLLAYKLNGIYGADNIYCYTFATPGTVRAELSGETGNIFNVLNVNDVVPMLPPAFWGYKRLGTDIVLGEKTDTTKNIEEVFASIQTSIPDIESYYTVKYSTKKAGTDVQNGKTFYEFLSGYFGMLGGETDLTSFFRDLLPDFLMMKSDCAFAPFKVLILGTVHVTQNHLHNAYATLLDSYQGGNVK